ncbi:MAG: GNAT family N-acetyltransferase [Alphaproteobacteria bacterium]|nr:GNAT family N-acetyltransferase [Alphaproteobacteria bacterium]
MDIRFVEDEQDIRECLRLRRIVFIEEQGVSEAEEVDGRDPESRHVLVRDGRAPIAAARVRFLDDVAKIERVCVLSAHRGKGLGAQIMKFILAEMAADPRIETVRLGAQTHALAFYQRLGFVAFGDEYLDAGIPHRDMKIDFKNEG